MRKAIVETVASSSAHGISRAASTQSIPLRVAWILLFLGFLGLFCNTAVTLVKKLINVSIVTTSEVDSVPFEYPDLYFCPIESFSGSYPYTLSKSEAAIINDEVEKLSNLYDKMMNSWAKWGPWSIQRRSKDATIKNSMSPQVLKLLIQRREQSVNPLSSNHPVKTVLLSAGLLCFKAELTKQRKERECQATVLFEAPFSLQLFTDPYNPHFNYTGHPIRPIVDAFQNRTVNLSHWDSRDRNKLMQATGYTLIMVPEGAFPTKFDTTLSLAPGRSYDIVLRMEQIAFSKELHGRKCSPDSTSLYFVDLLSRDRVEYNSSLIACFMDMAGRYIHRNSNVTMSGYPIPWELRHSLRLYNLTEMLDEDSEMVLRNPDRFLKAYSNATNYAADFCERMQPCESRKYRAASFSSHKWLNFDGLYPEELKQSMSQSNWPAMRQLAMIAERLHSGDHSAQGLTETEFRNFLSDSMLRVNIKVESPMSTRLVVSYSYSWTAFLADIGGLLGLYIGCSLLTVCELLELLYHLMMICADRRRSRDHGCRDQELTGVATEEPAGGITDEKFACA